MRYYFFAMFYLVLLVLNVIFYGDNTGNPILQRYDGLFALVCFVATIYNIYKFINYKGDERIKN